MYEEENKMKKNKEYIKGFEDGIKFTTDIFNNIIADRLNQLLKLYKKNRE